MRRFATVMPLLFAMALVPAAASPEDFKPFVAKLASQAPDERISGLRELMRRKAPADVIRPQLEKLLSDPVPAVRIEVVWAAHELLAEKGTDLLEKLYGDPDHSVRDSAVRAACRMFDKSRPKELCRAAFDDPDFAVKSEVINTLKEYFPRHADATLLFRRGLKDASESVQRAAVFGVQAARDAGSISDLSRLARTSNDLVAVPAVEEALATVGTPEAITAIIELLARPPGATKPTDNVRAAAARSLARIKASGAVNALRPLLDDPTVIVRIGAIEALSEIGDKGSAKAMVAQLSHAEARVRKMALRALRRFKDPNTADAVAKALRDDKDPSVRASAASCLADILGEKAIPRLAELRSDLDASVRLEAAGALGGLGKPAVASLVGFLKDPDPSVQALAIEGVGRSGGREQLAALLEVAQTANWKNRQIRISTAQALGAMGLADGLPQLETLAADTDPQVRGRVATSLGQIGGAKAKTALEKLSQDPVSAVRQAAQKGLETLAKRSLGARR